MKTLLLIALMTAASVCSASEIQGTDFTITTTSGSVATSNNDNN